MSGFESPNYTQAPNDFFAMIPDMLESELRVTLVLMRQTFGFHREGFSMPVGKLAKLAGLSRQGTLDGVGLAEKRGTFRRSNPGQQGEAEWELIVRPLHSVDTPLHPVEGGPLLVRDNLGVKESINKKDLMDGILQNEGKAQRLKNAEIQFEACFGFTSLPWSKREWERLGKWLADLLDRDSNALADYVRWRKFDGKYQAMSNNKIRQDPQMFMDTGWPTFLAHTSMYAETEKKPHAL